MKSNAVRAIIGVAGIAIAIVLFVVLQDDGGKSASEQQDPQATKPQAPARTTAEKPPPPPKPKVPAIVVRGGQPVGGVEDLSFNEGERIRFKVTSDVEDEIHIHGYDLSKEIAAGGSVSFDFPADIEGVFEVELEHRAVPIAEIQVNP